MLVAVKETSDQLNSCHSKLAALEKAQRSGERQKILEWIYSSVDPSENYNNAIKSREPETGLWFLESDTFAKWIRSPKLLWLTGIRRSSLIDFFIFDLKFPANL